MPELPEVETVKTGMENAMLGAVLQDVLVHRRDLRTPIPDNFEEQIRLQKIVSFKRRSKYVLMELANERVVIIHLGMSGRIRIEEGNPPERDKHDHVEFVLDTRKWIRFGDPRRFGFVDVIAKDRMLTYPALVKLGPEPLEESFKGAVLYEKSRNKLTSLKAFLMDQRIVAGLGNIYVNEALYRSGLSPEKQAKSLTKSKADKLVEEIKNVLLEAIEKGGSSLRDHRQTDGELGYFQHSFQVYGREGEMCKKCEETTIERLVQQGRSTFYCPKCQQ